ncbi:aldo-keto reductase, putative [Coniochaeta sp. 2T2.1]|nr:aldo-keto reductase, putative [Coniochaeta sp. 2T2.1]
MGSELDSSVLRSLGKNGPLVPRIGFGTMGMGFPCSRTATPIPDPERLALLDHAYEVGETFWDMSDYYGDVEVIVGKWIALNPEKRKDLFLATKFGAIQLPNGFSFRGDAAYVPEALEKSLARLNTDYIDLYYPHRVDGSTPIELIVAEMAKRKEAGKIRHLGLSEVSSITLRRACAVHHIAAVQMEYSAFSTEIEDPKYGNLLATCRELGVAVVAYSPFSRGLLSGGVQGPDDFDAGDIRRVYPRFSRENFPKNMELVGAIKKIADKKGVTVGQVALAWLLAQGDDIFPIPGTITPKYIDENFAAANVQLTREESQHIRDLVTSASVFGDRWPPEHALGLFADTPELEGWTAPEEKEAIVGKLMFDTEGA